MCVCRLNSSVCNSKQIWNSDTCRCDCNEDFAGIINCTKGYMWNPSTCEYQCDIWCKPGQYLDHKNCVCKNKLIGRVIAECTSIINETMMNNKKSVDNNTASIFIGLFSLDLFVFAYLLILSGLKIKIYLKINILIIEHIKMDIKSLEIKFETNYNWADIVYINEFDPDLLKIIKRESRFGTNIYYIEYILDPYCLNIKIKPLYFVINRLIGYIEEIEGSSDKYLVVSKSMRNNKIIHSIDTIWKII